MFSRRHYKAIAEVLRIRYRRELRDGCKPHDRSNAVAGVAQELSDMFQRDNPAFNLDRFSDTVYN